MKKILISSALAFVLIAAPLSATAQTTTLPGSNNNLAQLTQLVELLERLLNLQEQLSELLSGDAVASVDGTAGEGTATGQEISVSDKERMYMNAVSTCTTNRISNSEETYDTKADFADYALKVLSLPRISLQKKVEMISDRNTDHVQPELKRIEGERKSVDATCNNTIVPVAEVVASSSPAIQAAVRSVVSEMDALKNQLTANKALPDCMRGPLSESNAGLSQIKDTVKSEKCKAKSDFLDAQIVAKQKQQRALESI